VISLETGNKTMTANFFCRAARIRAVALRITIVACLALMAKAAMVVEGVPLLADDQQGPPGR